MTRLSMRLLGTFEVYRDNDRISEEEWRTERNKALLKLLLTDPGEVFTTETLMEQLWPDTDPQLSRRNLQGRVSELRRILEPSLNHASDSSFIETARTGYRFIPDHCDIDVQQFQKLYQDALDHEAQGDLEAAIAQYREAASLYRGRPLPHDSHEDWAIPFQEAVKANYRDLLIHLVDCLMSEACYDQALPFCRKLIGQEPYEEAHYRRLMTCHFEQGEPTQALIAYHDLRHILSFEFQISPAESTQDLARQIREASDQSTIRDKLYRKASELGTTQDPEAALELIDTFYHLGEHQRAYETIQHALAHNATDDRQQAWLTVKLSRHYQSLGQFQQALDTAKNALKQFEQLEDQRGKAASLSRLSRCHFRVSQLSEADHCAKQSADMYQELGDKDGQAGALCDRANAMISHGEFAKARSFLDAAYRLTSAGNYLITQGRIIYTFGFMSFREDYHGQAKLFLRQAYEHASSIANHFIELLSLEALAVVAGLEGHLDENISVQQRVIDIRKETGETDLYVALNNLGTVYQEAGRYDEAINCFREALELEPQDDPSRLGMTLCNLGSLYVELEQYRQAEDCLNEADSIIRDLDDQWWHAKISLAHGYLSQAIGHIDRAVDLYEQAHSIAHSHGNNHLELEALSRLLDAFSDQNATEALSAYIDQAEEKTGTFSDELSAFHYWALYRAFLQLGQHKRAYRYLNLAYRDLLDRADRVKDSGLRQSFLTNVPLHAQILSEHESR